KLYRCPGVKSHLVRCRWPLRVMDKRDKEDCRVWPGFGSMAIDVRRKAALPLRAVIGIEVAGFKHKAVATGNQVNKNRAKPGNLLCPVCPLLAMATDISPNDF
ncbi:MAG: hypothetical protein ACLPRE_15585, partial [Limisphaerales bacterium]